LFGSFCCAAFPDIPEKARHAPNYGPLPARQVSTHSDANSAAPISGTRRQFEASAPADVARTDHFAPVSGSLKAGGRHSEPSAASGALLTGAGAQVKAARSDDRSPAQFGLRMKNKMRFSRSLASGRPGRYEEPFPVRFDDEFVARLVQPRARQKRAILGSSVDNHDHHHDHHHDDEPIDNDCTILGVKYQLGQVVGVASDQCQECRCAAQSLWCSPKCCFKPAPFEIVPHLMTVFEETRNQPSETAVQKNPLHYIQSE